MKEIIENKESAKVRNRRVHMVNEICQVQEG